MQTETSSGKHSLEEEFSLGLRMYLGTSNLSHTPTLVSRRQYSLAMKSVGSGPDSWVWTPAHLLTSSVHTSTLLNPLCFTSLT